MRASGPSGPVIGAIENSLLTEHLSLELPYRDGVRLPDPAQGVHKLCVLERHGKNGNVGRGFVKGFGALRGALAGSVGHDSHNLIVVGDDDADMALAVNRLIELQGGYVAAQGGRVLAELALADRRPDERSAVRGGRATSCARCAGPRATWAARWPSRSCSWRSCRCR